jgi:hypothetical protein
MAVKTLYFKNAAPSGAATSLSLQDGGTAPTGALTATGWTVGTTTGGRQSAMLVGTERLATTFGNPDSIPSFTASSCWRTENAISGTFANTDWTLAFRVRAVTLAASQTGLMKVRIWKSTNADGSGATQLTAAKLNGTTTSALSVSISQTSTVTWTPGGTVVLSNEYLWVQCEWTTGLSGSGANADALIYVESAGVITTPNFTLPSVANTMTATKGTIATSPKTVNFKATRELDATVGAINLNEQTAGLSAGRRITAQVGAVVVAAQTAVLSSQRKLTAVASAVTLTGKTADLVRVSAAINHVLTAQAGAIELSGKMVDFTEGTAPPTDDYTLDAEPGILHLAGQLAALTVGRRPTYPIEVQPGVIRMGYPRIRLHAW